MEASGKETVNELIEEIIEKVTTNSKWDITYREKERKEVEKNKQNTGIYIYHIFK